MASSVSVKETSAVRRVQAIATRCCEGSAGLDVADTLEIEERLSRHQGQIDLSNSHASEVFHPASTGWKKAIMTSSPVSCPRFWMRML